MSQTERILFIDRRIRLNGKTTIFETAKKFEVSVRQVKRDIEYLRDRLQAPIIYDRKIKGYIYETEFHSLEFADQSLMLFYVMIKSLAENHHYIPIYSNEILKQLESSIPEEYHAVVPFAHLDIDVMKDIVRAEIAKLAARLKNKKVELSVTDECVEYFAEKGCSPEYGARNVSRLVDSEISTALVDEVLFGHLVEGGKAICSMNAERDAVVISYESL